MHTPIDLPAFVPSLQVSAHTGHSVVLVDLNNDLLTRAEQRIKGSLQRVAKKQFLDDQKVCMISRGESEVIGNYLAKKSCGLRSLLWHYNVHLVCSLMIDLFRSFSQFLPNDLQKQLRFNIPFVTL